MRRSHIDQRYVDDPRFHEMVDLLEHYVRAGEFTPTEIREALFLAQMKYEMNGCRPVTFSPDLAKQVEYMTRNEPWRHSGEKP